MISNRPYLIRAIYEWIVDNGWTPHLQVDANYPGSLVPQQFVQDGVIVLNVHPDAIMQADFDNLGFNFKARFQGVEQQVAFAPEAVLAVFARENGQGMPFPPEPYPEGFEEQEQQADSHKPTLQSVEAKAADKDESSETDAVKAKTEKTAKKSSSKKPTLTIVK